MKWTADIAYVVGLITTDGSLSIDGRHINLTSKDIEQIHNFATILNLKNKIGKKVSSYNPTGIYYQIQFGNVDFYKFLIEIGLCPHKSKTLRELNVPDVFLPDFLRGHLDGDGYTYSYWDKRWKSSFMLYTGFISASRPHVEWIQGKVHQLYGLTGRIKFTGKSVFQLLYAKKASISLLKKLYYDKDIPSLSRKRFKIEQQLSIIDRRGCAEMVDRHA